MSPTIDHQQRSVRAWRWKGHLTIHGQTICFWWHHGSSGQLEHNSLEILALLQPAVFSHNCMWAKYGMVVWNGMVKTYNVKMTVETNRSTTSNYITTLRVLVFQ